MIAFVNRPPTVESKDGMFIVTVASGGEASQFALTRHAFRMLGERCRLMDAEATAKDRLFEPTPFQRKQMERSD